MATMDLLKLFALLVAVATVWVSAEGPKKKIRIHLPQKVKHIHHHKKIYITNHPATSQYAPAYMPSAEGAMSVPTSVGLPAMPGLLPGNSMEMFDEPQRVPSHVSAKLLPLYRARGYYGPNPTEWDDQEAYDLSPPPEPTDHSYVSPAFSGPSAVSGPFTNNSHKKVKIIKLNEPRKKNNLRKGKPKRVPPRKPQLDEEIPVSTFHEQFYSDLDGSATLRKVKKPQRVEKIIDGDTEHIHTYSEEHVHKLVYGDGTSKLIGVNPVGSMSAAHSMFPVKNSLLALSPEALTGFTAMGTMGTPAHLEYSAYSPHEVTHDHVFHDHGEIPADADISKENLPYSPRVSYTSQGIPIGGQAYKGHKNKYSINSYPKPTKPTVTNDYSYYENMYQPYSRPRVPRPTNPTSHFSFTTESTIDDYNPISSFKSRDKTRNTLSQPSGLYFGNTLDYQAQQSSDPAPFAVSSTVVHDYKPKSYASHTSANLGFNKLNDPLRNFKDNSYTNNFDYNSYAASSNLYTPENKYENPSHTHYGKKGKKKSISTQNIRIGGLDHQTTVDHLGDSRLSMVPKTTLEFDQSKGLDSATSTPYTIRESSLAHSYYTAMAEQALNSDHQIAEASANSFQYVEAPPSTTDFAPVATTSTPMPSNYFENESTDLNPTKIAESTEYIIEHRSKHTLKDAKQNPSHQVLKDTRQRYPMLDLKVKDYKSADRPAASTHTGVNQSVRHLNIYGTESSGSTGSLKYGDKI